MVKKLSLAAAGKKFFWVIFNMVIIIAGGRMAKFFRVLSSYGKNIITGGSRRNQF